MMAYAKYSTSQIGWMFFLKKIICFVCAPLSDIYARLYHRPPHMHIKGLLLQTDFPHSCVLSHLFKLQSCIQLAHAS